MMNTYLQEGDEPYLGRVPWFLIYDMLRTQCLGPMDEGFYIGHGVAGVHANLMKSLIPEREKHKEAKMNPFRQLRWKLTLSYIIVTVSSFLVILLIMSGLVFTQIFMPENALTLEGLVENVQKNVVPAWSRILEETADDPKPINLILENSSAQFTQYLRQNGDESAMS